MTPADEATLHRPLAADGSWTPRGGSPMRPWRFRVAICVTVAALGIATRGLGTVASAADRAIPVFLAMENAYVFITGMTKDTMTVVAIDSQSCWVKVRAKDGHVAWVNLRQVLAIEENQHPSAQAKPGQRR
jgi:hypothetical protein